MVEVAVAMPAPFLVRSGATCLSCAAAFRPANLGEARLRISLRSARSSAHLCRRTSRRCDQGLARCRATAAALACSATAFAGVRVSARGDVGGHNAGQGRAGLLPLRQNIILRSARHRHRHQRKCGRLSPERAATGVTARPLPDRAARHSGIAFPKCRVAIAAARRDHRHFTILNLSIQQAREIDSNLALKRGYPPPHRHSRNICRPFRNGFTTLREHPGRHFGNARPTYREQLGGDFACLYSDLSAYSGGLTF